MLETEGINIDRERTKWHIYDGNENVIHKQGARTAHAFAPKEEAMGYPVMVEMFYKGSSMPFVGYTTIDVEEDELLPVIKWDVDPDNKNVVHFNATAYSGENGHLFWLKVSHQENYLTFSFNIIKVAFFVQNIHCS